MADESELPGVMGAVQLKPRLAGFSPSAEQALICQVGTCLFALPVGRVVETMRRLPLVPLAGAPPFVMGTSIVRGTAIPVVDLAALLGDSETPLTRMVTVRVDRADPPETCAQVVALAVSGVVGVRRIPPESLAELPPLLAAAQPGVITALGVLDARTLFVLESARIVPDEVWADLPRSGGPR